LLFFVATGFKSMAFLKASSAAYEKANKIEPNEDVYYNMGSVYAKSGKFEKAIGAFKKAIESN
jgi:tetratricopeptide (TPR) repeat protein